jgi:hypothetical protein
MEALLLTLGLALIPIYTSASGGIQYSHLILALLMALRLIHMKWKLVSAEVTLLALFVLILSRETYSILVQNAEISGMLEVLYIAFAMLMLITFSRLSLDRKALSRAVIIGLVAAAVVSWIGIWRYGASFKISDGEFGRSVGTFNNPNQLAYFSICTFSIASLLYLRDEIKAPLYLALTASSLWLAIASLSKAGLLAIFFGTLVAVAAMLNRKKLSGKLIVVCLLISGAGAQLFNMGALDSFSFVHRIEGIGSDSDDNLTERGYRSPFEHGALGLLVGLGDDKVKEIVGHEVHSTFWSYLMKYGVIGLGLFLTFWFMWVRRTMAEFGVLGVLLINVPASFYGITHNGSRFAIFWLLIGLSFNLYRSGSIVPKPKKTRYRPGYGAPYSGMAAIDWHASPRP